MAGATEVVTVRHLWWGLMLCILAAAPVSCSGFQCGVGYKPLRLAVSPPWAEHFLGPSQDLTPQCLLSRLLTGTVTWACLAC